MPNPEREEFNRKVIELCLLKTPNACDSRALEKLEGIFSWSAGGIGRLNRDTLECKPSGTC